MLKIEIPYSVDTRLSSRLIAATFTATLTIGICFTQNISISDISEFLTTLTVSFLVGIWIFIRQNSQKIEITEEGILIEPDLLLFYKVRTFYKAEELKEIKLCPVDNIEFQRGYIEIMTKKGKKIVLNTLFPSQTAYFSEILSKTFKIPLDASDFIKLGWREGFSENVFSRD